MKRFLVLMAAALVISPAILEAQGAMIECRLRPTSASVYTGRCVWRDTTIALLVLRPPPDGRVGRWQGINARIFGHGGDTNDVVDWTAFSPAMADVTASGKGVFGSTLGWLAIRQSALDSSGLRLSLDPQTAVAATTEDLRILLLARAYFTDATRWNHVDTRRSAIVNCPPAPSPRTLFCAFYVASREAAGEFYGARPAGAALQAAIRTASARQYQHPLTDFNNDSTVTFAKIQSVFDDAIRRVQAALGSAETANKRCC
jgi:hypothetical protein